jgi:hypothetical protein
MYVLFYVMISLTSVSAMTYTAASTFTSALLLPATELPGAHFQEIPRACKLILTPNIFELKFFKASYTGLLLFIIIIIIYLFISSKVNFKTYIGILRFAKQGGMLI